MKVELLNATVVSVENRQIKLQNGDTRAMQIVQVSSNGRRGVQLDGVEVWDENIERLHLTHGQTLNLTCEAVGRMWGGRFSYTLQAYKAEQVVKQNQEGGQDPFGV